MKKLFICFIVFFLNNLSSPAFAQYTGPAQPAAINNAVKASRAADNMAVTLEGHLIAQIRDEHYTFRDDSGTIEVEIDRAVFPNVPVGPETRLRLYGEVDKDFTRDATVDVKRVEILQP